MEYATVVLVSCDEISVDTLISKITTPETGAVVTFTGIVRAVNQNNPELETNHLDYEAYQPMAEVKMHQVVDEIRHRWPLVQGILLYQRVGKVGAGQVTTVIACSGAHRDAGIFEAGRYGIDRIKEIVPVWKKEIGPQGEHWVDGHYFPKPGE